MMTLCLAGAFEACSQVVAVALVSPDARLDAALLARLTGACEDGLDAACEPAGVLARESPLFRDDPALARRPLAAGCDRGLTTACDLLAKVTGDYDPVALDEARRAADEDELARLDAELDAQLAAGCEAGDAEACAGVIGRSEPGSRSAEVQRALAVLTAACEAGEHVRCSQLGALLATTDPGEADRLASIGCDGGDQASCDQVAKLRGTFPPEPTREERIAAAQTEAAERAAALYAEVAATCAGGDVGACRTQASMRWQGNGTSADVAGARAQLEALCEARELGACADLGTLLLESPGTDAAASLDEVAQLFGTACEGGDEGACAQLEKLEQR
jgi:hypothetical protein